jgi:hypothetical protein
VYHGVQQSLTCANIILAPLGWFVNMEGNIQLGELHSMPRNWKGLQEVQATF